MFQVEKRKKKGELFFPDGIRLVGFFFTSPRSSVHAGEETIFDLLIQNRNFIPFQLMDGEVVIIHKECLLMVLLEEAERNKDLPYLKKAKVRLQFLSGEVLEGTIFLDLPKGYPRISDFLNWTKDFFFLEVQEKEYLIHRRFVRMVEPLPSDDPS